MKLLLTSLLFITLLFPPQINASVIKGGIVGYGLVFGAKKAIKSPFLRAKLVDAIRNYVIKHPEHLFYLTSAASVYAIENFDETEKLVSVFHDSGLISKSTAQDLIEESLEFKSAYKAIEAELDDIDPSKYCRVSKNDWLRPKAFYSMGLSIISPTKAYKGDIGSYGYLKDRSKKLGGSSLINHQGNEAYELDHIPAYRTILYHIEKYAPAMTKKEEGYLRDNASVILIPKTLHKDGRTYKGRNKALAPFESGNLKKATYMDMAYHLYNTKDVTLLTPFVKMYIRNSEMCMYEK